MTDWKCGICGFEAKNEDEKNEHMKSMSDTAHQELIKEKAKNKAEDVKEGVQNTWEEIKAKV